VSAPTLPVRARSAHEERARAVAPSTDVRAFGMDALRALTTSRAVDVRIVERDGTTRRDAHLVLAATVSGRFGAVRVTFDGRRRSSATSGSLHVHIAQERPVHGVRVPLVAPLPVTAWTRAENVTVWLVLTLGQMPTAR